MYVTPMMTTLTVPVPFKLTARDLSRCGGKGISALVVELIEREAAKGKDQFVKLGEVWKNDPMIAEELRERP